MSYELVTAPTTLPVSTTEAKAHLRVECTDDDTYIKALIRSAVDHVEKVTNRALISQTWNLWMDEFCQKQDRCCSSPWWDGERVGHLSQLTPGRNWFEIGKPPLQSVTSITTYNDADTATVFSSDSYIVDTARKPGRVVLKTGYTWPSDLRAANGIQVRFVAGYGPSRMDVDGDLRHAIKMIVAHWYENREPVLKGTITASVPMTVEAILKRFEVKRL